jgi:hypothetical protein
MRLLLLGDPQLQPLPNDESLFSHPFLRLAHEPNKLSADNEILRHPNQQPLPNIQLHQ